MRARRNSRLTLSRQVSDYVDPYEGMSWWSKSWLQFRTAASDVHLSVWVVYLTVFLYSMSISMQLPSFMFIARALGASIVDIGLMRATFGLTQLACSVLAPHFVSAYGTKFLLIANFASAALSYTLTGTALSVSVLFVSRLPSILQHGIAVSKSYVNFKASREFSAEHVSWVTVASTLGFVVGPFLGGYFSSVSLVLSAWVGVAICAISAALVVFAVDEDADSSGTVETGGPLLESIAHASGIVMNNPAITHHILAHAVQVLGASIFMSALAFMMWNHYAGGVWYIGLLFSAVAVVEALSASAFHRLLSAWLEDSQLSLYSLLASLGALTLAMVAPTMVWFSFAVILLAAASTSFGAIQQARLEELPTPDDVATVLTFDVGVTSLMKALAHILAATLLAWYGPVGVSLAAASFTIVAASMMHTTALGGGHAKQM